MAVISVQDETWYVNYNKVKLLDHTHTGCINDNLYKDGVKNKDFQELYPSKQYIQKGLIMQMRDTS